MSAQLEDGYTKIADKILEDLPRYKLNGTQYRILIVVWRYTYGFNRKDHELSLSFFVKATGLGKTQIDRELKNLIENRVLIVTKESTFTESRKIGFNKNFDEWKLEYSQQKSIQSAKTLTVSENAEEQSAKTSTGTVSKNADQDIHSFINNIKKNTTTTEAIAEIRKGTEQTAVSFSKEIVVNPFRLFESEGFGTLSSILGEKIGDFIDTYGERWVCEAMKEAAYYQKRNLPYVKSILDRYKTSGIDEPWIKKDGVKHGETRESIRQGPHAGNVKPSESQSGVLPSKWVKFDKDGNLLPMSRVQG